METVQGSLWHESFRDALRDLVSVLGGFKAVGSRMWPAKPADEAGRHLADCLNTAKPHKLSLEELEWLLCEGRRANCHIGMHYIARRADYERPEPVDPETELQKLQREYVEATRALVKLASRIDTKAADVSQLRRVA